MRLSSELENGWGGGVGRGRGMDSGIGRAKIVRIAARRESKVERITEPIFWGRVT